jgi:benzoyl-CoA 2,3-dioxygenase component B
MGNVNYQDRIPNNVDLSTDRRLQRALEAWQPDYLNWWMEMGPEGFQEDQIYLRTAVSVERDGWAHFDYVKMPEYRWGIFLTPFDGQRQVNFGDHMGDDAWQSVPGEYRNILRRIIVTQGDTEPASVEQQRLLGKTCPSLYDLRNLFQVNVEEGRHLWAMVYLLHRYFGRDGREEAEELLERRSGDDDSPRILGAFNEPCTDWLNFFCFATFTDRDGKYQLRALAESGFDPLARICTFMLTEEAHHMFVGQTGVGRVVKRTAERMKEGDPRKLGVVPLEMLQRHINLWYALSLDLFGSEDSSNAANFFAAGIKGRDQEMKKYDEHLALDQYYKLTRYASDGKSTVEDLPLRRAMNEVLRDAYVEDCEKVVSAWNRILQKEGCDERLRLPNRRFFRQQGIYAGMYFDLDGNWMSAEEWNARRDEWLPSAADKSYVHSLMKPVTEPGKFADWIAPPPRGINGQPIQYSYVEFLEE